MQPSMIVHDALAEAKNSDELYLRIYEHYEASRDCGMQEHNDCCRAAGLVVFNAIKDYEKAQKEPKVQGDTAENAAANAADNRVTDMKENAA